MTDEDATADKLDGQQLTAGNGAPRPPRKYVLFADGTGNAFASQESNVWRLYEALDRSKPDQVAYYIRGVGTSGWRPFAALDGATGIGVPSNVRKLYRFLCRNWQPGDQIYIFGFSRGAFTARTLAALIGSQGLMPAAIGYEPVTHREMQRNVMAAWREYRRESAGPDKVLWTIRFARVIRDAVLALVHRRHPYQAVRKAMEDKENEGRKQVDIAFLGLFDTVEAFGVPVEELRRAIDWAIWPISFRNRELSERVLCARHALALDDERTTFHPIRIDHPEPKPQPDDKTIPKEIPRVKEVWFAGVHSDVGGGYPDGTLSYVPLAWMAAEIGDRLRFQDGRLDGFKAYQSAIGPIHDSRGGAAVMYRYGPRPIDEDKNVNGGAPVVHLGVVERMLHGSDNYAPVMLPATAKVLLPPDTVLPLIEDDTRKAMKSALENKANVQGAPTVADAYAFVRMPKPDPDMIELTQDTVWWRRFAYFSMLGMIALLAAWPWIAVKSVQILKGPTKAVGTDHLNALDIIRGLDNGVGAVVGPIADLLLGFLPSYTQPWLKIAIFYPFMTTVVVSLLAYAWGRNAYLRDRIQERARLAWNPPKDKPADEVAKGPLLRFGHWMRNNAGPARKAFTNVLLPGIFLIVIFGTALIASGRSFYNWRVGTGNLCTGTDPVTAVGDAPLPARNKFDTRELCWASGLWVEKGRKYRIWIDATDEPWFDQTIMSGVNGFTLYDPAHVTGWLFRRWYKAAWFQPVLRIGSEGYAELPLEAINVMPADDFPRLLYPTNSEDDTARPIRVEESVEASAGLRDSLKKLGYNRPIPENLLPAARDVWHKQDLAGRMVAEFVADASGEVFLYVNDVVVPVWPSFKPFYDNNSGSALVTVQRMPLPPTQASEPARLTP